VKLLILGATGGIGRQLVTQALEAGHHVTAFVRSPEKIPTRHDRLRLVKGDVLDGSTALADAVRGQDALVSALGRGLSFKSENLIQRSVPLILSAMQSQGVQRLVFTSAIGVGETVHRVPFVPRLMARLPLRNIYADKVIGDDLIRRSPLAWTIVQPSMLTDGPLTSTYRSGERLELRGIPKISRADVAHFILAEIPQSRYVGKTVLVSY
jgi:putative NADH-flavin reductase